MNFAVEMYRVIVIVLQYMQAWYHVQVTSLSPWESSSLADSHNVLVRQQNKGIRKQSYKLLVYRGVHASM